MKRKILILLFIIILISCFTISVEAASIRTLLTKTYDQLRSTTMGRYYSGYLSNDDNRVICVHDSSYDGSGVYNLGISLKNDNFYYDKMYFNSTNGKNPTTVYYKDYNDDEYSNNSNYSGDVSFLSRFFYEGSVYDGTGLSWSLLHEYRIFCKNGMTSGFKGYFSKKGSFNYFVHAKNDLVQYETYKDSDGLKHYSASGKEIYVKSKKYSEFISALNNKFTINNKKYLNVDKALSEKETIDKDIKKNWKIEISAPYYNKDDNYEGVSFQYALINGDTVNSGDWKKAGVALKSGESGKGYKKLIISGSGNTNADTLVIKCSYPTYTGLALGFATRSGQERFLVNGDKNTYTSYIAYEIDSDPDVTISKKVSFSADKSYASSIVAERGDTIYFKVVVNNKGAATTINLSDTIPSGLILKAVSKNGKDWKTYKSGENWNGLSNETIDKGENITRFFECVVNSDASNIIKNTATVTSKKALNEEGEKKKRATAVVNVVNYKYNLTKSIYDILDSNGNSKDTDTVEIGDVIKYKILFDNQSNDDKINQDFGAAPWVYKVMIEDTLPKGLEYVNCWENTETPYWDESWKKNKDGTTTVKMFIVNKENENRGKNCNGKAFFITARVTEEFLNNSDSIVNKVVLTNIENRNGIKLDSIERSVSINAKTYNATIDKYITAHKRGETNLTIKDKEERNNWSNAAKKEAPVVVQKGDIITYTVKITNTGEGALKNIEIKDDLPDGLKLKGSNERNYKYIHNGTIEPGGHTTFNIECEVTMSNMYLKNIENSVDFGSVENTNSININIEKNHEKILKAGDSNADYIRLDDPIIEGIVWEDKNKDGIRNKNKKGEYTESTIPEIDVMLHHVTNEGDIVVASEKTNSDGKYSFGRVKKGTDFKDTNKTKGYGYYPDSSTYEQYYIEFKYNGVSYISTEGYKNKINLTDNGSIKANYKEDSNAAEITSERDNFNRSLETICYNKATGNGTTKDLLYTKNGTISILNLTDATAMSSYSFVNKLNGVKDTLWLKDKDGNVFTETEYLKHINLGLVKKDELDLQLTNKIDNVTLTINGQRLKYDFASSQNNEELKLYKEDLEYKNDKDDSKNLNVEVTYKTIIKNNSKYYVKINELTNYYDSKFLDYDTDVGTTIKIDTNKYGEDVKEILVKSQMESEILKPYKIGRTLNCYKGVYSGLQAMEINLKDKENEEKEYVIDPNSEAEVLVTYRVKKEELDKIRQENKDILDLNLISIIEQYSVYSDEECSIPAGVIDCNSNPGNLGLGNSTDSEKCVESGMNVISADYERDYYENDTKIQRLKLKFSSTRTISGFVWEDKRQIEVDGQKIGDGRYDEENETLIKSVTVKLFEIDNNGNETEKALTTTDDNGKYKFSKVVPGNYMIKFGYGNDASKEQMLHYNVQDYKSTKYTGSTDNLNCAKNIVELLQSGDSNARDDERCRLEVMQRSLEIYNDIEKRFKAEDQNLIIKTDMFAETPIFTVRNELVEEGRNHVTKTNAGFTWDYKLNETEKILVTQGIFDISNIDFGLEQRPLSDIKLDKYISEIKLTTSSGDVLVDALYKFNSDGKLIPDTENSKGTENLQALDNTNSQQGFRYLNVDEELLQGATIQIKYGFKVTNISEVDHISPNLYSSAKTTAEIKQAIDNAIKSKINNNKEKYSNPSKYYGEYLGSIYYTGSKTANDEIASLKVDMLLDYVDNELSFSPTENEGKWGTMQAVELLGKYLDSEEVLEEGKLMDNDEIEYQTGTKNNLAVTKYDNGHEFSKLLVSNSYIRFLEENDIEIPDGVTDNASTELTVSTFLSPENDSENQMVYENIAEIIQFTTLTGRKTVDNKTVGNAKVYNAGYRNDGGNLGEDDTSITEKVLLTPPTGLGSVESSIRIIAYVVSGMIIIILGILYIPKLVDKIKNRKFIK